MKISWVTHADASWMDPVISSLQEFGHIIVKNHLDSSYDVLFGATISVQGLIKNLHDSFPNVPMMNYNWDVYEWAYNNPNTSIFPYDVNIYRKILENSKFVICPSWSVVYRNEEFFKIPKEKSIIVKSFARQISIDSYKVKDGRFVYMPLRQIPDRNRGWFEKACLELNIPYRITNKGLSNEDYIDTLVSCSFLVCPWYEASTGGLSLIEGVSIGKPVIFSDSKYMGAKDYLGEYGITFKYDDYEDFKVKIKNTWDNTKKVIVDNNFLNYYKPSRMAKELEEVFRKCLQ